MKLNFCSHLISEMGRLQEMGVKRWCCVRHSATATILLYTTHISASMAALFHRQSSKEDLPILFFDFLNSQLHVCVYRPKCIFYKPLYALYVKAVRYFSPHLHLCPFLCVLLRQFFFRFLELHTYTHTHHHLNGCSTRFFVNYFMNVVQCWGKEQNQAVTKRTQISYW